MIILAFSDLLNPIPRATKSKWRSHAESNAIPMLRDISYNKFTVIVLDSLKGAKNMEYKAMRDRIEDMVNDNHRDFVKAIISIEKGINDESALDKLYDAYMDNDSLNLLNEEFDYMIEELREQGQIKDLPYVQTEKDNLVNIVGNIVEKVDIVERENKNGETFKVANFSVVSKNDEGDKVYHNCSAYGEKSDIPKDFQK